ncbi:MAG: tyrosinase [Bradyrhizobium sp.]|jgi:tyrosinase|nr:tyrosinase [Bradyrhizobium sp.]
MARKKSVVSAKPVPATGYERVKQILSAAARPGAGPGSGGKAKFWDASLDDFKKGNIYGVRLIADEPKASCCASESRSANSGLIKALRGEAPFDGTRFPPRPWGGAPVAEADIQFIADWIDDGCPADDHQSFDLGTLDAKGGKASLVKLTDVAEFEAFAPGAKRYAYREGEPRQRQNLDCLGEHEIDRLRTAFRTVFDLDDSDADRRNYNNQALIHQNHCQHGWERFLTWHRAYLYEFEQNLQDFDRDIMLPYWDWTMPQYMPEDPTCGCIIPQSFKAFLTPAAVEEMLTKLDPKPNKTQADAFRALAGGPTYFVSQHRFFCTVINDVGYTAVTPDPGNPNRQAMIYALLQSNALWYPLRYPAEYAGGGTIESVIHYHYPTGADMAQIMSLNNFRDFGGGSVYDAAFGFLDQNPHNTMHIWTGGMNPDAGLKAYNCPTGTNNCSPTTNPPAAETQDGEALAARRNATTLIANRKFHSKADLYTQPGFGDMFSNLTASYDPIFWPIHVNIDRVWWEWQSQHPTNLPADLDAVLSPWSYTARDMLEISRFGYEYVRCSFFMPVGMEAPITRFVSKPIKIAKNVRKFRKAEIRLHWVPQLMRSCFIRAFINQPGADASTPMRDNPHYAGYLAIFGHGECYGGPGHCDLPPVRARAYDQRPRNHNTPRNHRIDVTEAARRVLANSDQAQITLVVIGVDYREERDLLKLEGVSLNFLD